MTVLIAFQSVNKESHRFHLAFFGDTVCDLEHATTECADKDASVRGGDTRDWKWSRSFAIAAFQWLIQQFASVDHRAGHACGSTAGDVVVGCCANYLCATLESTTLFGSHDLQTSRIGCNRRNWLTRSFVYFYELVAVEANCACFSSDP